MAILSLNFIKLSSSLVSLAITCPVLFKCSAKRLEALNVISFSFVPERPIAPGSLPPCPGSIVTTHLLGLFKGDISSTTLPESCML